MTAIGMLATASTATWAALACWCIPAVCRLAYARGRARHYDPMRLVVLMLTVTILMFSLLRSIFGMHAEAFGPGEAAARIVAYLVSIAIAGSTAFVIRSYDKTARP